MSDLPSFDSGLVSAVLKDMWSKVNMKIIVAIKGGLMVVCLKGQEGGWLQGFHVGSHPGGGRNLQREGRGSKEVQGMREGIILSGEIWMDDFTEKH